MSNKIKGRIWTFVTHFILPKGGTKLLTLVAKTKAMSKLNQRIWNGPNFTLDAI